MKTVQAYANTQGLLKLSDLNADEFIRNLKNLKIVKLLYLVS